VSKITRPSQFAHIGTDIPEISAAFPKPKGLWRPQFLRITFRGRRHDTSFFLAAIEYRDRFPALNRPEDVFGAITEIDNRSFHFRRDQPNVLLTVYTTMKRSELLYWAFGLGSL